MNKKVTHKKVRTYLHNPCKGSSANCPCPSIARSTLDCGTIDDKALALLSKPGDPTSRCHHKFHCSFLRAPSVLPLAPQAPSSPQRRSDHDINYRRSWSCIIVHGARECANDYVYYHLAIRSSLSIRHVKLVARQWRCPIVCPISRISPAYGCI